MTLEEALNELGAEAPIRDDELRRAYLRKLKRHKPEVDPQGFQRVREAYDLARASLAHGSPALLSSRPEAHDLSGPPLPGIRVLDPPRREVAPTAGPAEVVEVPEEPKEPWELLADAYDAAASGEDRAGSAPPAVVGIRAMLDLHARGKRSAAEDLEAAFGGWLARVGEARVLGGPLSVGWAVVRELRLIGPRAPSDLRKALARAARDGSLSKARSPVEAWQRRDPAAAETLAVYMARRTPVLSSCYGALLFARGPRGGRAQQKPRHPLQAGVVTILCLILFRAFSAALTPQEASPRAPSPSVTSKFGSRPEEAARRLEDIRRALDQHDCVRVGEELQRFSDRRAAGALEVDSGQAGELEALGLEFTASCPGRP